MYYNWLDGQVDRFSSTYYRQKWTYRLNSELYEEIADESMKMLEGATQNT